MEEYVFEKKKLKNYLGDNLYNILKKYKVIVAGGTITSLFTNREINDIDIYFRSKEDLRNMLLEELSGQWIIAHTDKAILFKYDNDIDIQAIYFKYFNNAEEIFNTFDFTVCMGTFDFSSEQFIVHNDFFKHNSQRILKFNQNTAYPIVSALRIDKYKKKGYSISKPEFIRIMLTILKLDIKDYKTLKEQMGGMYGENYDKLLKPQNDEVFNLQDIIEKMSNMCVEDDYFKQSKIMDIDDWEEFVYKLLGEKIKCFTHKDIIYTYFNNEIRKCKDYNEDEYEMINVEDIIKFPLTRYKYVNNKFGDYRSFYSSAYKYKIGEYCEAQSTHSGLHATKLSNINTCSFSHEDNHVLLELRIDSIDDVFTVTRLLDNNCDYNRVFVVREIPKEEEKEMRDKSKNNDDEDDFWI